jgi:hypothetical protein
VPYNPGEIPESAFAPLECFVADAQEPTEEPFTSVIPSFVDTAETLLFGTQSLKDDSTHER